MHPFLNNKSNPGDAHMSKTRIKMVQSSIIILGFGLTVVMNACSELKSKGASSFSSESFSIDSFSKTLYPVIETNCASCHGGTQIPLFAIRDNAAQSHEVLTSNNLVNLVSPSQSFLVTKLSEGHNNFPAEVVSNVLLQISTWAQSVRDFEANQNPIENIQFSAASRSSVLMKIKAVSHGAALTQDEWDSLSQGTINQNNLKDLVNTWIDTPEGKIKMDNYIRMTLNQDVTLNDETNDIFNRLRNSRFEENLRESFTRTVRDLIDRGRPFTEIATTNRYAVTTAILSGYAWLENEDRGRSDDFRELIDSRDDFEDIIQDSDFTDWRFVTFQEVDEGGLPRFDDLPAFRNMGNNSTVQARIPKVGYFSSLAFIARYPTNGDNQFRNVVNQTLISGLGSTFNPSDNTPQPLEVGIPADHAERGTQCYSCHRMMDPMRLVFGKKMNFASRAGTVFDEDLTSFAFQEYIRPMTGLDDLGAAIADHPDFAEAWVQKMCRAFNTSACSVIDSNFQAIVARFKASNFSFKEMYTDLLTSAIVTGSSSSFTSETVGFNVARTRRDQFCHSLEARQKQILLARGRTPASFNSGEVICGNRDIRDKVNAIGEDQTIRGVESVINSYPLDAFTMQAIERTCAGFGVYFVNANNGISTSEDDLDESIDLLTRYIAGLPATHPRHDSLKDALRLTYQEARETHNMNARDALREVATLACTTPDSISMGL